MLTAYERRLLAFYLANAASSLHHRDREAFNLAKWASSRANRAAFGAQEPGGSALARQIRPPTGE